MREKKRVRRRPLAFFMDKVDLDAPDARLELGKTIEFRFLLAPVVVALPVSDEVAHISEVDPEPPWLAFRLIRQSDTRKTRFQIGESILRYVDFKGGYLFR